MRRSGDEVAVLRVERHELGNEPALGHDAHVPTAQVVEGGTDQHLTPAPASLGRIDDGVGQDHDLTAIGLDVLKWSQCSAGKS